MSKYPIEEIVREYTEGKSMIDLHKKYGISYSYLHYILGFKKKVLRPSYKTWEMKTGGWRKLTEIRHTRLLNLPRYLLREIGLDDTKPHKYKWSIEDGKLFINLDDPDGSATWNPKTTIISLPFSIIKELNIDAKEGKWVIENNRLRLLLR